MDGGKPGAASKKTLVRADGEEVDMPAKVRDVPVFEGDRLIFEKTAPAASETRWSATPRQRPKTCAGIPVPPPKPPKATTASWSVTKGLVDAGATESKREEIKAGRGESPRFDHGDLPPLDEQRRMIAETRRKFNEWLSGELGKARGNRR